ncbi:MAG: hypothetical protein ABI818_09790, partial [Acidobacteriota bacterium]
DRMRGLLHRDERESHRLCFARKAAAFLRNSSPSPGRSDEGQAEALRAPLQVVDDPFAIARLVIRHAGWATALDVAYTGRYNYNGQIGGQDFPININTVDIGTAFNPALQDPTLAPSANPGASSLAAQNPNQVRGYRGYSTRHQEPTKNQARRTPHRYPPHRRPSELVVLPEAAAQVVPRVAVMVVRPPATDPRKARRETSELAISGHPFAERTSRDQPPQPEPAQIRRT